MREHFRRLSSHGGPSSPLWIVEDDAAVAKVVAEPGPSEHVVLEDDDFTPLHRWVGFVTDIDEGGFDVALADVPEDGSSPYYDKHARLSRDLVLPGDWEMLGENSMFEMVENAAGDARIRFVYLVPITRAQWEQNKKEAAELIEGIRWE